MLSILLATVLATQTPVDVIPCHELDSPEFIQAIVEGELPDLAISFPAGSLIPLELELTGDFLDLDVGDAVLVLHVKRDFYVRFDEEQVAFSVDCVEWKPFTEIATGSVGATVGAEQGAAFAKLFADIREREPSLL